MHTIQVLYSPVILYAYSYSAILASFVGSVGIVDATMLAGIAIDSRMEKIAIRIGECNSGNGIATQHTAECAC